MKKLGILILLVIHCVSFSVSCSSDKNDKSPMLLSLLGMAGTTTLSGTTVIHELENILGPSTVNATRGDYTSKVGVDWSLSNTAAVSYNVYRSTSSTGTFDKIKTVKAADINTTPGTISNPTEIPVEPPVSPDAPNTPPVLQAVFQSDVNLNQEWVYNYIFWKEYKYGIIVKFLEEYNIEITIDGTKKNVSFYGPLLPTDVRYYVQNDVISKINSAFGKTVCYAVNSGNNQYIKLVSNGGQIVLKSVFTSLFQEASLRHFLKSDATGSTIITVNPVAVNTDTTPPVVMTTYPANGATNIALNAKVWASFSEAIKSSSVTGTSFTLKTGSTAVAGSVSGTAIFTPSSILLPMTDYTAALTTAVTDLAGNHLTAARTWTFTTGGSQGEAANYCYIDSSVTPGQHYFYKITSVFADGTESEKSQVAEGFAKINEQVPGKVTGCTASDGAFINKVTVAWNAVSGATYYRVIRTSGTTSTQIGGNITGTTADDTAVTPGIFYYRVVPYNASGEGVNSDIDVGFRAITNDEFFSEVYNETAWGLARIQKMKASGTGMLGEEVVYDKDGDGTLVYNASASLSSATLKLTFNNFSAYYLTQNTPSGAPVTAILSDPLGSCSGPMTGKVLVAGVYNGYIRYELNMIGGAAKGGSYWVSQNGGAETNVPYNSPLVW